MDIDDRKLGIVVSCLSLLLCTVGMLTLMGIVPDLVLEVSLAAALLTLACAYAIIKRRVSINVRDNTILPRYHRVNENGKIIGLTIEMMILILVASILVYVLVQLA